MKNPWKRIKELEEQNDSYAKSIKAIYLKIEPAPYQINSMIGWSGEIVAYRVAEEAINKIDKLYAIIADREVTRNKITEEKEFLAKEVMVLKSLNEEKYTELSNKYEVLKASLLPKKKYEILFFDNTYDIVMAHSRNGTKFICKTGNGTTIVAEYDIGEVKSIKIV